MLCSILLCCTSCTDRDYLTTEIEEIDSFTLTVNPIAFDPSEPCTITLSGTLSQNYADATASFSLYKDIDNSYQRVSMYAKDDYLTEWTACSGLTYPIDSDAYADIRQTLQLLVPAEGVYKLHVHVHATDTLKEYTDGVFETNEAFIVKRQGN